MPRLFLFLLLVPLSYVTSQEQRAVQEAPGTPVGVEDEQEYRLLKREVPSPKEYSVPTEGNASSKEVPKEYSAPKTVPETYAVPKAVSQPYAVPRAKSSTEENTPLDGKDSRVKNALPIRRNEKDSLPKEDSLLEESPLDEVDAPPVAIEIPVYDENDDSSKDMLIKVDEEKTEDEVPLPQKADEVYSDEFYSTKTKEDPNVANSTLYNVNVGAHPYVVSFFTKASDKMEELPKMCLGALIDPSWVVTASHCLELTLPPNYYTVFGGLVNAKNMSEDMNARNEQTNQSRVVDKIIVHPRAEPISSLLDKNSEVFHHNVALLHLHEPFQTSADSAVNIIRMAAIEPEDANPRKCVIFGWGEKIDLDYSVVIFENTLRYKEVKAIPHVACDGIDDNRYSTVAVCPGKKVPTSKSSDNTTKWYPCSGNDGGPLVCHIVRGSSHMKLMGISIWNGDALFCSEGSGYILLTMSLTEWIEGEIIRMNSVRHGRESLVPEKEKTFFLSNANRLVNGILWLLLIMLTVVIQN